MALLPPDAPVELVHWPRDETQRALLARRGVPCLILVAEGVELPKSIAVTEDWVRLPADERDVDARARGLCRRLARTAGVRPKVGDGIVAHGGRRTSLSVAEATALKVLVEAAGAIVSRAELEATVWPDGPKSPRSLDALLYRLRRRAAVVNIHVLVARGRGVTIDVGPVAVDTQPESS